MNQYFKIAKQAAKESGKIFIKYFGKAAATAFKNGDKRNLVTNADTAIEKTIRKIVSKAFPDHLVLGEELGGVQKISKHQLIWIIDPIDGTNNFAQGIPLACISVALWDFKGPLLAVVYNPITESLYTAQRGQGAYLNGKKITVSQTRDPFSSFGSFGWTRKQNKQERLELFSIASEKFGRTRALGTTTLQTCFVADRKMDFYLGTGIYIWDFAAAALIVTEAGGKVTEVSGKPLSLISRSIIASNKKLHPYILKNLR